MENIPSFVDVDEMRLAGVVESVTGSSLAIFFLHFVYTAQFVRESGHSESIDAMPSPKGNRPVCRR